MSVSRTLIAVSLLILAVPAFAADTEAPVEPSAEERQTKTEDALLTDWLGLIKVLRSYGIHNSQVAWRPIEELCLGIKNEKDHVPYNRCRLEKAIAQVEYRDHSAECTQEAEAAYPARLLQYRPTLGITGTEIDEDSTEFFNSHVIQQPLTRREFNNKRAVTFRACMRELGWRDPDDWRKGRKE